MFAARYLDPQATGLVRSLRRRGRSVWPLHRRGAELGYAVVVERRQPELSAARRRWAAADPVFLPGILSNRLQPYQTAIASSLRMFDRLRRGGSLLPELARRLHGDPDLRYAGNSAGGGDPREVERVHVDAWQAEQPIASDLWAMLAWLATDDSDVSSRIRFSCGSENPAQWLATSDLTAGWVDLFAARAFPECDAILGCASLREILQACLQRPHRLSERILYNNTPGGGAVFHHDAEPGQLGVIYSQLSGATAWLAIAKRRLAALLVRCGYCKTQAAAMAKLDDSDDERLWRLLNRDASFTAGLAARGALFVLEAGDCIALPSHSTEDVAWHSVIGLGRQASLAHSYGIFRRNSDYPAAADGPTRGAP